jgi:hypothetical protein
VQLDNVRVNVEGRDMTTETRTLPAQAVRVETGAVQFGDDWPGVFIRGDNALYFAYMLDLAMNGNDDWLTKAAVEGLRRLLVSCDVAASERATGVSGGTDSKT